MGLTNVDPKEEELLPQNLKEDGVVYKDLKGADPKFCKHTIDAMKMQPHISLVLLILVSIVHLLVFNKQAHVMEIAPYSGERSNEQGKKEKEKKIKTLGNIWPNFLSRSLHPPNHSNNLLSQGITFLLEIQFKQGKSAIICFILGKVNILGYS